MAAEFDWVDGTLTLEFPPGKIGIVRCLSDPNQIPGDVDWVFVIAIDECGECELKAFNGKRGPSIREGKRLIKYFKAHGYTGEWIRAKNGKKIKTVKV